MKRSCLTLVAVLLLSVLASASFGADMPRHHRRILLAAEGLNKMAIEEDASAFADTLASCKAVAIFPAVVKGGLGITGGMSGEGIVLRRDKKNGWYGPSYARIDGESIGLQLGLSELFLVLTVVNDEGMRLFTGGTGLKLGADVSVAAGPVGREASAATDSRAKASVYSYSMSKGAFAGIGISGSLISLSSEANKAYWGKATDAKTALNTKASGEKIKPLIDALNKIIKMAK